MGWIKDCVELCVDLSKWGKRRWLSNDWKARLGAAHTALLRERPDLATAYETLRLAQEAGYDGPELHSLERRLEAVRDYEETGYLAGKKKPSRSGAKKSFKKSSKKSAGKKSSKKRAVTKKAAKKPSTRKLGFGKRSAAIPKKSNTSGGSGTARRGTKRR